MSPSLGRNLSTGQSVSVGLVEPKTEYGERLYQARFPVREAVQRESDAPSGDASTSINALNGNAVLVQSNNYGATTGATTGGRRGCGPQAILPARIVKFGVQVNF